MTKKGFTLMEVLTVVIIVSILTAVALPRYSKFSERARFTKAEVMAKSIHESCDRLVAEFGYEDSTALIAREGASVYTLSRFDMGSSDLLPVGFELHTEASPQYITGAGFKYELLPNCGVAITKPINNSFKIIYRGSTLRCYGDEDTCDIYGVEYMGGM